MTKHPGQLSLFDPSPPAPNTARPRRAKKPEQVRWIGPGHCRACQARLYLYQTTHGLKAWIQPNLVPDCPNCGLALTTTTVQLATPNPETGS